MHSDKKMKDIDDITENAVRKIQACWRGFHTRKKLKEVYDWYKTIVLEIDGNEIEDNCYIACNSKNILKRPLVALETQQLHRNIDTNSVTSSVPEVLDFDITQDTSEADSSEVQLDQKHLLDRKQDIVMELFWVQQAIESRRNYLLLKNKMDE